MVLQLTLLLEILLRIQSTANFRIKDYNNRLANFTTKDIQCYNGVIHVVDRFLKPNLN